MVRDTRKEKKKEGNYSRKRTCFCTKGIPAASAVYSMLKERAVM